MKSLCTSILVSALCVGAAPARQKQGSTDLEKLQGD
jgi:hypothetical protein